MINTIQTILCMLALAVCAMLVAAHGCTAMAYALAVLMLFVAVVAAAAFVAECGALGAVEA